MAASSKAKDPIFSLRNMLGLIGLGFFIGLIVYMNNQGDKLREDHRYTIGTIYKTHWSLKSGKFADSKFIVGGVEYEVSADADKLAGQQLIGRRFLVEFHPPKPQLADLFLNAPIPEDIQAAPAEGWESSPVPVPKELLK